MRDLREQLTEVKAELRAIRRRRRARVELPKSGDTDPTLRGSIYDNMAKRGRQS